MRRLIVLVSPHVTAARVACGAAAAMNSGFIHVVGSVSGIATT
jgi:hypothetical protein